MKLKIVGALLAGVLLGITPPAVIFWSLRAPNRPPAAKTPAEERVLAVLDRMTAGRGTYLPIAADDGRKLRLLVEATEAKRVVEIGTSTGYSALWICLGLQNTGGTLKTFEIDAARAEQARRNFEQAGVSRLVDIVFGDAHKNVEQLEGPIDLLFLDADKQGYTAYLQALLPRVRPGGLIAVDNTQMIPDYLKVVTSDPQLETVIFGRFAVTLKKH